MEKAAEAVRKENEKLKEDVRQLRQLLKLQRQVIGGTKFTASSVEAAARYLKQAAGIKGSTAEFAKLLNGFYEAIAQDREITWESVKEQAQPAVQWMLEHRTTEQGRSEYEDQVLREVRNSRTSPDEPQNNCIAIFLDADNILATGGICMSYSIRYGPEGAVYKTGKKMRIGYLGVIVVLTVCLLAVGWALPQQAQQLRQILFPWTGETVEAAFLDFCADIRQGEPFRDAAAAFCLEILNESDMLQ